jgi:hypothetical protein
MSCGSTPGRYIATRSSLSSRTTCVARWPVWASASRSPGIDVAPEAVGSDAATQRLLLCRPKRRAGQTAARSAANTSKLPREGSPEATTPMLVSPGLLRVQRMRPPKCLATGAFCLAAPLVLKGERNDAFTPGARARRGGGRANRAQAVRHIVPILHLVMPDRSTHVTVLHVKSG